MPVSSTATTTPSPVKGDVSALTVEMPQASVAAATPAGKSASQGPIREIGIGIATAATCRSCAMERASAGVTSCTSILGSGGAGALAGASPKSSKGLVVLTRLAFLSTMYSAMMSSVYSWISTVGDQ